MEGFSFLESKSCPKVQQNTLLLSLLICYGHIQDPAAIHIFPEFVHQGVQLSPGTFELFL